MAENDLRLLIRPLHISIQSYSRIASEMRREDRRTLLLTSPLLDYSKIIEIKHGFEHLPKTKLFCAFQHHLLSRIICPPLPTSKRIDIYEVNCYSNCPTLHRMMMTTFNLPHVFHNYAQHELVVYAHSNHITSGHH